MSNPRSASNAWANIKKKLVTNPDGTPAPTPKKGGKKAASPKAKKDNEDGSASPTKKTPKKRVAKKQEVEGESSPKKKGKDANGEYL